MADMRRKYKVGDLCIVTGDAAGWNHRFTNGSEVVLMESFEHRGNLGWDCEAIDDENESWRVAEMDLETLVTEADLEEVKRSLGLA